jgi:hypothetical protein
VFASDERCDEGSQEVLLMETVKFTAMKDGTREDYELLRKLEAPHLAMTADRILREMRHHAEETLGGYQVTRLEHGLQSATRAYRDGADLDWICAALLHDIGDGLAPQNHDRFAAEILRPFIREECAWVVEHHGAFQMIYYAHHMIGIQTSAINIKTIPIITLVPIFASDGIKPPLTPIINPNRSNFLSQWFGNCSPARPMIRKSFVQAR